MADPTNGSKQPKASPPPPLPKTLIQALPAASDIIKHATAIERLLPQLEKELQSAKKRGAIDLARAFTVFHRMVAVMGDKFKPLYAAFERYKVLEVPAAMETAGITHVPLDEGYRIGVSYTMRASIKGEMRDGAYTYLRKHYPDVIIETVNSSTLSSLARELQEEHNKELPAKFFNVANVPNTSVTRVQ